MKIEIEIPEEFIGDLKSDRFEDFFQRALADMNGDGCGGNYERETARMFICAFKNGIINNQPQVQPIVRSAEEIAEEIDKIVHAPKQGEDLWHEWWKSHKPNFKQYLVEWLTKKEV